MTAPNQHLRIGILATNPLIQRGLVSMFADEAALEAIPIPRARGFDDLLDLDVVVAFIEDGVSLQQALDSLHPSVPTVFLIEDESLSLP